MGFSWKRGKVGRGERLKIGRMGIPEGCVFRTLFCDKSEVLGILQKSHK